MRKLISNYIIFGKKIFFLENDYCEHKKENYISDLSLYKPDSKKSICQINELIKNLSNNYEEIIVFAFDALSYNFLYNEIRNIFKKDKIYPKMFMSYLTSVFPTTTATAWPSIITGVLPSEHGIYGTSFRHENINGTYLWINHSDNTQMGREFLNKHIPLNMSKRKSIFHDLNELGFASYYLGTHGQTEVNSFRKELISGSIQVNVPENYQELKMRPNELVDYFLESSAQLLCKNGKKNDMELY